jgi:GDPmannose 4,6-dehydratase
VKAFITGVSGQDGFYMAKLLLSSGCNVIGITSRDAAIVKLTSEFSSPNFKAVSLDFEKAGAIEPLINDHRPDLFFNFAALATGSGMFNDPARMARINGGFVLDVLEAARRLHPAMRICQASSAEMYGDTNSEIQNEESSFRPKSPYGAAKLFAHNMVAIYRSVYGIHCSSAILFNHESVRRPDGFVTRKIARAAARIKLGMQESLALGHLSTMRDWGSAPEYVAAMWLMATQEIANDYVVATGKHTSLKTLCEIAFDHVNLDYADYVKLDSNLIRSIETQALRGSPERIFRDLGWRAQTSIASVIRDMVDADLRQLKTIKRC